MKNMELKGIKHLIINIGNTENIKNSLMITNLKTL